mmetsp:Transcript_25563/g.36661  ORF Transcript_25563/g.36661 Transcript_25563/m.36661 type:complete len:240 (+) Transcript_25563:324-1043(+)
MYESRKGLEVILFDLADPTTLVSLIYRLRQVEKELDRRLSGVLINLFDFVEDHREDADLVDIAVLDGNYKALLKGPVRLLQTIFELVRHQMPSGSQLDLGGLRVVTLAGWPDEDRCGSMCLLQDGFLALSDDLQRNLTVRNVSYSAIHSPVPVHAANAVSALHPPRKGGQRGRRATTREGRLKHKQAGTLAARYRQIEAFLAGPNQEGWFPDSQVAGPARAILHAFLSVRPQRDYHPAD